MLDHELEVALCEGCERYKKPLSEASGCVEALVGEVPAFVQIVREQNC